MSDKDLELDNETLHALKTMEKPKGNQVYYEEALSRVLPLVGNLQEESIFAEVMIALKLDGIIGETLNDQDFELIDVISESILEGKQLDDAELLRQRALSKKTKESLWVLIFHLTDSRFF